MNYSQEELKTYKEKPSKQFNHPHGLSRQEHCLTGFPTEPIEVNVKQRMQNTSSMIKNLRDFRSCLTDITGSSTGRGDQKDVLRYNHQMNDFEYSQPKRVPLKAKKMDFVARNNVSSPIVANGEKSQVKSGKRMSSTSAYRSQIVLGNDKPNDNFKSHSKIAYSGLKANKENLDSWNRTSQRQSSCANLKASGLREQRPMSAKGQRPHEIKNAFQSQIVFS